jgi:acyl carrier protein
MSEAFTPHRYITSALSMVAPDVDTDRMDADLHDDLGLDSMDLLNLAAAISLSTGIEIAERDFPSLRTMRQLEDYLSRRHDSESGRSESDRSESTGSKDT